MTDPSTLKGVLMDVRRFVSQRFWNVWQNLPVSGATRAKAMNFAFTYLPILVSWSASYHNWSTERVRLAAQLAKIAEFRHNLETSPAGWVPNYVDPSALPRPNALLARAIAFYLPQFHAIPENDKWWGNGFTEWTNVRRARPQFQGHRQPRRPGELGYYDLGADAAARRRQAALAHQYGLAGFCFYFYWFDGKILLEGPIRAWENDAEIDFPYCLCWANESWSRRWDGREDQKLITQHHSPEDDIAFIRHISDYLQSDKYLRVSKKPLIIVYRPDKLPDAAATAKRWRNWCRENGMGEIFLAYTLSFASGSPEEYGFDAAIEFPPNNMGLSAHEGLVVPTSDNFEARIYDLHELAVRSSNYNRPTFKLFRGVTPQWDNTARRMNHATVMLDGGPAPYERWLINASHDTMARFSNPDERLVFINAWNEWAEGAYLEPDSDRGYAWLQATRRALSDRTSHFIEPADLATAAPMPVPPRTGKVIVVVHDLSRNGAQMIALNLIADLRDKFGIEVATIVSGDGPLGPNFAVYGAVIQVSRRVMRDEQISKAISELKAAGYEHAIVNSSASGWLTPFLAKADIACIGLVHELPEIIQEMSLEAGLEAIAQHANHMVFPSAFVQQQTAEKSLRRAWPRPVILPQGFYKSDGILDLSEKARAAAEIRARLGVTNDAMFVLGVGFGDYRKGVDIFCRWGLECAHHDSKLHFIWLGELHPEMKSACHALLENSGELAANIHLIGYQNDTGTYYKAATAYALTSREDPFPSTVLEALACGTPVFAVAGTTGSTELAASGALKLLPDAAPETFHEALRQLIAAPTKLREAGRAGVDLIRQDYGRISYAGDLLRLSGLNGPRISVVVPNYNYARYLPHRIATILAQDLPVWEIIFLDDASTDDSIKVAADLLKDCGINYRIVPNMKNTGSVFAQWKKGIDLARGDIVWIAEADDWASARFTRVAVEAFDDPDVVISYTQSQMVDEASNITCPHYLDYVSDIDRERWRRPFLNDGIAELNDGFAVKNTIPNVSGALFRRDAIEEVFEAHLPEINSYRVAGDWCAYVHMAALGKVAFDPRPLNFHRRHTESVTVSRFTQAEWDEIARMQMRVKELAPVTEENVAKASVYLEELKKRL